ncbi:hypothetical protein Afe05nite_70910 [Paractinoplanes ferrugineus]|uniref:Uncharacterized protein n=1 Tax=Paractinoplanes ferrugineus TaxID=113564 RepID=A0A919J5K1_9ACTN|nr:hypothetical protein Afe05nite_70910 [Actinoplanes ferrugineus]
MVPDISGSPPARRGLSSRARGPLLSSRLHLERGIHRWPSIQYLRQMNEVVNGARTTGGTFRPSPVAGDAEAAA